MARTGGLQRAIQAAATGDSINVLQAIRADTQDTALITKLVEDHSSRRFDERGNQTIEMPTTATMREMAGGISSDIQDVDHIFATFPDLELAAMILISSILAPKDLVTTEVEITLDMTIFNAELGADVQERFNTFFETTYKIKDQCYDILYDMLFRTGSYAVAVIPENAIDEIINGHANYSTESHSRLIHDMMDRRSFGVLGPAELQTNETEAGLESFSSVLNRNYIPGGDYPTQIIHTANSKPTLTLRTHVTDNINYLKLPDLIAHRQAEARGQVLNKMYGEGLESRRARRIIRARATGANSDGLVPTHQDDATDQMSDYEMRGLIYKHRHGRHAPVRTVPTQDQLRRRSVDEPLVMVFPSESVIPCHVPGNFQRHVGYFVILDKNGYPVSRSTSPDLLEQFRNMPGHTKDFASSLLARTSLNVGIGSFDCNNAMHRDAMLKTFTDIIEANLSARLRNGINSTSARIATTQDVMQIMLARELAGDQTQLLWVPIENMTYFANDYDNNGIGRSLISRSKNLFAMRAGLLYAEVAGGIKNSIGRTKVAVQLDEVDFDNDTSIELLMDKYMRTRQEMLPLTTLDPADLGNWITRAGVEFTFEGGEDTPDMRVDISEHQSNFPKPDSDLRDMLEKTSFRAVHITPELLETVHQPEHATGIVNNNIMLSRRVIQHQNAFNPLLTDHCQKRIRMGSRFVTELTELIWDSFDQLELPDELRKRAANSEAAKETIVNMTVTDIIDSLVVQLVRPRTVALSNQVSELEEYEKALDLVLDNMFNTDILSEDIVGQEFSQKAEQMKMILKSHYLRRQMSHAGFMAETISELSATDKENQMPEALRQAAAIAKNMTVSYAQHLRDMKKFREDAETIAENSDISDGGSSSSSSSDNDDDQSSGGDSMNFLDDPMSGGPSDPESSDPFDTDPNKATDNDYPDMSGSGGGSESGGGESGI